MNNKIVVVIGPTASGKTNLAKKLIKKLSTQGFGYQNTSSKKNLISNWKGELISADSRQIFKYMDLGTGKDKTFHQYLIDIKHPNEKYSVAEYQKDTYKIINNFFKKGITPFLVGGSMLYIDAVLKGFQFPKTNIKLRLKLEKLSSKQLYGQLLKLDPISAEKNQFNQRRLIRALEVVLLNSRPQSEYKKKKPDFQYLIIGINIPRKELYQRIDKRVDQRIKEGMIKEVKHLLEIGVSYQRLQEFGLEYRYISQYLTETKNEKLKTKKEEKKQEMIQKLKFKIHAFARRQLTWWRRNKEIKWIKSYQEAEYLITKFINDK